MEDLVKDKEEIQKLLEQSQREYVKKMLKKELEIVEAFISSQSSKDEEHKKLNDHPVEYKMEKVYSLIDKYGWSDEGKNVKVYVTSLDGIGALDKSKINCKFTKHSFDLTIDGYNGKSLRLCASKLYKEINPDKCKFNIKSSSISITLSKAKDAKWTNLKESEKSESLGGGYPGMSLDDEPLGHGGEPKEEAKEDPNKGLMEMMKKMYEEGDEETKKMMSEAMMKGMSDQK